MEKSRIQLAVEEVYEAAETEMDEVISLQPEHGKCYNFSVWEMRTSGCFRMDIGIT